MKEFNFPGVAIAVVKDGKIFYQKGFGYRDIENSLPVTHDTLFAIGSTTKAFTSTALGMMADDGIIALNAPVQNYLPDFAIKDETATRLATPIDLLSHRTGFARHDALWYGTSLTREELLHRLRYLESAGTFRDKFDYNNLMYMVAGIIVDRLGGKGSWEEFVKERILTPLGMNRTNFSVTEMLQEENAARPYELKKGHLERINYRNLDAIAPAGAINSSVGEMAKWLIFNLNKGSIDGRQLIKAETHEQLVTPRMVLLQNPLLNMAPEIKSATYGLGWGQFLIRNRKMIWHNGGIDGFVTDVSFIPEKNLGIVVMANATHQMLPMMVSFTTYDTLLDDSAVDWGKRFRLPATPTPPEPVSSPAPYPLNIYSGVYAHDGYGQVQFDVENGLLYLYLNGFKIKVSHWKDGVFKVYDPDFPDISPITFHFDARQNIIDVEMKLEPTVAAIKFRKL